MVWFLYVNAWCNMTHLRSKNKCQLCFKFWPSYQVSQSSDSLCTSVKNTQFFYFLNMCNSQQTRNGDWYVYMLLNMFIHGGIALLFPWKHLNLPKCEGNEIQNGMWSHIWSCHYQVTAHLANISTITLKTNWTFIIIYHSHRKDLK